jgi:outer membrane protein assembly factor BamE (lipoprotein component of BamABCDE complex)
MPNMHTHPIRCAPRRSPRSVFLPALAVFALTLGCVNTSSGRGVEARWHDLDATAFVPGQTTRSEVMEALGPPSQILTVGEETAFYYMLEMTEKKGLILLIYNTRDERTSYDRAVYFFDANDVLTDFAHTEVPD